MGIKMKYFVLNPRSKDRFDPYAKASWAAMRAYANHIQYEDHKLATDLREWAERESDINQGIFPEKKCKEGECKCKKS